MALLDELAAFIGRVNFRDLPAGTVEDAKLHVFDSLGALLAGSATGEARANAELVRGMLRGTGQGIPVPGFDFSAPLPLALLLACISTRMTETDDIDIASCTTVGSVVVPAALLLAFTKRATGRELIEGAVAGYEILTRLRAAVKGAEIIYQGIWTTYLCAASGVAAAGSRILGLDPVQARNALAISLTLSTGLSGKTKTGLSSRWLTLGCAAQNGLIAVLAAARGFAGDETMLDGFFSSAYGLELDTSVLLDQPGGAFRIGKVNLKPYCSARQAVSSIEAFRQLLRTHELAPDTIEEVEVTVPKQYSQMLDMADFPVNRLQSITSIRYQLALAAFYEDDLFDIERKVLRDEPRVRAFMKEVRIASDDRLTAMYPEKWSGRVMLRAAGRKFEHEVLSPIGDSARPLSFDEVGEKMARLCRPFPDRANVRELGGLVSGLDGMKKVDDLLRFLHRD